MFFNRKHTATVAPRRQSMPSTMSSVVGSSPSTSRPRRRARPATQSAHTLTSPTRSPPPTSSTLPGMQAASNGWLDVGLLVLMVLLLCTSMALPVVAWDAAVQRQSDELDEWFATVVAEYHQALDDKIDRVRERLRQYASFLEYSRTADSFAAFSEAGSDFMSLVMFIQPVPHVLRAQFEREAHAELSAFSNRTGLAWDVPRNISHVVPVNGTAVARGVFPYYAVVRYTYPPFGELVMRDVLSNPNPLEIEIDYSAPPTSSVHVTRRVDMPFQHLGGSAVTGLFAMVRDVDNPSVLTGITAGALLWPVFVPQALQHTAAASVRVQLYELRGPGLDTSGCSSSALFDGVRSGNTGRWELRNISTGVCLSPYEHAKPHALLRRVKVENVTYLVAYSKGPEFDSNKPALSRTLFYFMLALACVALLHTVIVVMRLRKSRAAIMRMHASTMAFFSVVTHELRNPLFGLMGMTGILREHLFNKGWDDAEREALTSIETSSERMLAIINDVLSMRKLEEGKMELEHVPFEVRKVASELRTTFDGRAEETGVEFAVLVDDDVPVRVVGDDGRVVQMVSNLVSNALKFTAPGGSVIVHIQVAPNADSEFTVLFTVQDSGCGIPASALPDLFTPYKQVDASVARTKGGTGLGMSIVKMFAEAMDGRVAVDSEPGVGTEISVTIPFQAPASLESVPEGTAVLIVDDQDVNLRVLRRMLERLAPQLHIEAATSGQQALDLVVARGEAGLPPFQLVLVDIIMPIMDGRATALAMRAMGVTAAILAVTGSGDSDELRQNERAGFDGTLLKPVPRSQLESLLVRTLLTRPQ